MEEEEELPLLIRSNIVLYLKRLYDYIEGVQKLVALKIVWAS
jgi:hypothetical protein